MKTRLEQFAEYAQKYGFPESMAIFAIWNAWQDELSRHEMQPPETAPHDRRIIIFDDAGKSYCAEYKPPSPHGVWRVTGEFWFWNIAGWKEIP